MGTYFLIPTSQLPHKMAYTGRALPCLLHILPASGQHKPRAGPEPMIPADRGISVLQVRRLNVKHTTGNTGESRHTQGLHTGSHRWTTLTKDFKKSFIKILSYQVEVGGFSRVILHTQISVWRHSVSQWERFPEGPPAKDQYILWRL